MSLDHRLYQEQSPVRMSCDYVCGEIISMGDTKTKDDHSVLCTINDRVAGVNILAAEGVAAELKKSLVPGDYITVWGCRKEGGDFILVDFMRQPR